jgi:hypothetical protein
VVGVNNHPYMPARQPADPPVAACVRRPRLFDDPAPNEAGAVERITAAINLCHACHLFEGCAAQGIRDKATGVVGGQLLDHGRPQHLLGTPRPAAKKRKRNPRPECGTRPGYHAHLRADEAACDPCLDANRTYRRELARWKRSKGEAA